MGNQFYAMVSRMKYIERWALMRNARAETVCEHSLDVAMIAHGLAVIAKKRQGKDVDISFMAMAGMYHDCTEIITGDMPTPIKYYNDKIQNAYKEIEHDAANQLLGMLPQDLQSEYEPYFHPDEAHAYEWKLVKAADKLSAYIKCLEERHAGNNEFLLAEKTIRQAIDDMHLEEAEIFMSEYMDSYNKMLDELI